MTYHVNFSELATAFSALASEAGVTILDTDNIPPSAQMITPVMFPQPAGFVSNLIVTLATYGTAGLEKIDIEYDLTYTFLYSPLGTNFNFEGYQEMISLIASISATVLLHDTLAGCIDFRLSNALNIGPASDPAGNEYHGCDFVFHVKQLAEVA